MSQPVKVLIADDEQIMREGLRLTIDWESYGFSVIGAVSNGEKALRLCEEETPDLVITDIRMPVMDGLDLTRELISRYPKIKIIILSAYDDFKYAQKAISYGASEYLLKSELECDHLLTLALKMAQEIAADKKSQQEAQQLKNQLTEHLEELQNTLCWNLLITPQYPPEIRDEIQQLGMKLSEKNLILIHVFMDTVSSCTVLEPHLLSEAKTLSGFWLTSSPRHSIFIGNAAGAVSDRDLSQEMKLLRQKIQQQISNRFSIFYSPIFCGFENVYWNNEQIQKYSQLFLFYERYHENHCVRSIPETEHLPISSILTKYLQLMECSQLTSAGSLIQEVCASFHEHFYHPDDVKELLALICAILKEKAAGTEEPAKNALLQAPASLSHTTSDPQNFFQYSQLSALLADFQKREQDFMQSIEKNLYPYHTIVKKAIQYIHEHLGEEITLQSIAKEIFCSPTYLSQIFKEEVRMNFSDFLVQARMKQAILLLTTTSLSIREIADRVGIPNQSYFSRSFIRFTGMQPSKYRQNFLERT
jgi:two-component system response regulator YesN